MTTRPTPELSPLTVFVVSSVNIFTGQRSLVSIWTSRERADLEVESLKIQSLAAQYQVEAWAVLE